jgi:hypothetical protein
MATLLKVLNNLADIKSAGGVALGLGTQARHRHASPRRSKHRRVRSLRWPAAHIRGAKIGRIDISRRKFLRAGAASGIALIFTLTCLTRSLSYCRGPLSSAKCNTPGRFDIGKVVQDLKERCHAILSASVGTRSVFGAPPGGRWAPSPGRSVGRKPPSPGSCSGTHSPRVDIRRFTPPEPVNCAGGVKRS